MSVSLHINTSGTAAQALADLGRSLGDNSVRNAIGGRVQRLFQDHFRDLNTKRANKLGGQRTNFYAKAARATFFRLEGDGVTLTVAWQGINQRLQGGVLRPTGGRKFLTIPARAEAYGKRAGEFSNLRFEITDHGPALVQKADEFKSVGRARKDGSRKQVQTAAEGVVMFWLRRSVTQKPDPTVVPGEGAIRDEISAAVNDWARTIGQRN